MERWPDLSYAWIWYIGIDLNAAVSSPRSPRIACTHLGVRPMPLQVWSGFCGLRYFAGRFWRWRTVRGAVAELGEDVGELVAVRGDAALELTSQVLSPPLLARGHLGLGIADQILKLSDVESCKVDGCHWSPPEDECQRA